MSANIGTTGNWGSLQVSDEAVQLVADDEKNTVFSIGHDEIENCTLFRNDIKIQLKKQGAGENSEQNGQAFTIAPCELKFSMAQDVFSATEDAMTPKQAHERISSHVAKRQASHMGNDESLEQTATLVCISTVSMAIPYGTFDLTVKSSSIHFQKEKKGGTTEDSLQVQFHVPIADIHLTFLLPYPVSQGSDTASARKYLVIVLNKSILIGSTRHSYIVCAVDDDDEFTQDEPLSTTLSSMDDLQKIFNGKIADEDVHYREEGASIALIGAKSELLVKIVKGMAKVRTLGQSSFQNATNPKDISSPYVRCMHRSANGHLYLLEKYFLFLHKPVVVEPISEIQLCTLEMTSAYSQTFTITFDMKSNDGMTSKNKVKFANVPKKEYLNIQAWLSSKGVPLKELSDEVGEEDMDVDSGSDYEASD